ncbi:hypothetical protein QCA50_012494 [Cerrena zonata]|uniref:Uncharacterized protein n=1 Tax=Cerrena zonata TaxID=2478898 RepID=A0AAW0FWI5_9APHY
MDFELRPQLPVGRTAADSLSIQPTQFIAASDDFSSTPDADGSGRPSSGQQSPVDEGWKAWTYCASGFVLETLSFVSSIFQAYYKIHPPFNKYSDGAITAVGPAALAQAAEDRRHRKRLNLLSPKSSANLHPSLITLIALVQGWSYKYKLLLSGGSFSCTSITSDSSINKEHRK